jgi:hypothetical protein
MLVPTLLHDAPIYETLRANLLRENNVTPKSASQQE